VVRTVLRLCASVKTIVVGRETQLDAITPFHEPGLSEDSDLGEEETEAASREYLQELVLRKMLTELAQYYRERK
jgi:hypothetical protein